MIRHLLFKHPKDLAAVRVGDWIASFDTYPGDLALPPLPECPFIGDVSAWQATPDNAARILTAIGDRLRFRCPELVQVMRPEYFQGALYFHLDRIPYILAFRSTEVTPEVCRGLQEMAGEMEETEVTIRRRGLPPVDRLEGLETAEVWTLGGGVL